MSIIKDYDFSPNYQHRPIGTIRDYKGYKLTILGSSNTPVPFGNATWEDSIDTLGMKFTCEIPRNYLDKYMRNYDVAEIGDKVLFTNNGNEIFRGIITSLDVNLHSKTITAHDYGYFLNKSNLLKQFIKMPSSSAVSSVCSEVGLPVGSISGLSLVLTKIYQNQSAAEIIKDIIKQNEDNLGIEFRLEMRKGKLVVEPYSNLVITPITKPSANVSMFDASLLPLEITKGYTLDDVKNKVVITTGNDKNIETLTTKTAGTTGQFGTFQEVVNIPKEDRAKAESIASDYLKLHSKAKTTTSVKLFGDDKVRAGRVITLFNKNYGIDGMFLIESCTQHYSNNVRTMSLDIREVS